VCAPQDDIVKLQILNLATKLSITNPKQTRLLCQYVFNLAKYDLNYDIRDRSRFLRQLIMPASAALSDERISSAAAGGGALAKHVKKIFLATKPAPVLESKFKGQELLSFVCVLLCSWISFDDISILGVTL